MAKMQQLEGINVPCWEDEAAALERGTVSGPLQGTPKHLKFLAWNLFPGILLTVSKVRTAV
jgi:hypothetical protein